VVLGPRLRTIVAVKCYLGTVEVSRLGASEWRFWYGTRLRVGEFGDVVIN
jgi:hypothetical protein